MSNTDKDDIRARLEAEEKQAAGAASGNRRAWWRNVTQVRMPKMTKRTALGVAGTAAAYFAVGEFSGAVNNHKLEITTPPGGSALIETFNRSMTRELNSGWCPSSSILSPSHIRIDMCAFQEGKQEIYIRLAQDLMNHLTRQGFATKVDPQISAIQQAFNRGNHWSITPWSSTYDQYRAGTKQLEDLQKRLEAGSAGDAALHYRIENLAYVIANIASNVGSKQANLRDDSDTWFYGILGSRVEYYHALGVLSGACEVLSAVQTDFDEVLRLQSSTDIFKQAVDTSCSTLGWSTPLVISSISRPALSGQVSSLTYDLQVVQNALAAQGLNNGTIARRPVPAAPPLAPAARMAPR